MERPQCAFNDCTQILLVSFHRVLILSSGSLIPWFKLVASPPLQSLSQHLSLTMSPPCEEAVTDHKAPPVDISSLNECQKLVTELVPSSQLPLRKRTKKLPPLQDSPSIAQFQPEIKSWIFRSNNKSWFCDKVIHSLPMIYLLLWSLLFLLRHFCFLVFLLRTVVPTGHIYLTFNLFKYLLGMPQNPKW